MNQVKGTPPPAASLISAGRAGVMSEPDDFLDKLSRDDPHYELAKRFHHEAWAASYGLEAEAVAGRASFSDFIDGCVHLFKQAAETIVGIRNDNAIQR